MFWYLSAGLAIYGAVAIVGVRRGVMGRHGMLPLCLAIAFNTVFWLPLVAKMLFSIYREGIDAD